MAIYFIQASEFGPVKIGSTNKPLERFTTLQGVHYEKLFFRHLFEGGFAEEFAVHQLFDDYRFSGEWFLPIPKIVAGDISLPRLVPPTIREPIPGLIMRSRNGCWHDPEWLAGWRKKRRDMAISYHERRLAERLAQGSYKLAIGICKQLAKYLDIPVEDAHIRYLGTTTPNDLFGRGPGG